jgi:hypothetical protein
MQARIVLAREDWRSLPPHEQSERLNAYVREVRMRGFDLARAPQTFVALCQVAEDTYHFVWAFNYMLEDGWSYPLILHDILATYEARGGPAPGLTPRRQFQDFIALLRQQDLSRGEAVWRKALQGYTRPARHVADRLPDKASLTVDDYVQQGAQIPDSTSAALQALAREHHLTVYTLVQGAWALLLSRYSEQPEIVFGSIVSGRPPTLDDVEYRIGLFNNLLLVRARVLPETPLLPWLHKLLDHQVEMRQYEHTPLRKIHDWCGIPRDRHLVESYLVFENFPMDPALPDLTSRLNLRMVGFTGMAQTEHPLRVVLEPSVGLSLIMCYYRRYFDDATIARLMTDFQALLAAMAAHPEERLGALLQVISRPAQDAAAPAHSG